MHPVHLLQKYNLTAKEVSKKSKNTSHTIERKIFAFRAFGRPKGQKIHLSSKSLNNTCNGNHLLIKLQALVFNSTRNKLPHSFSKILIKSEEE